MLTQYKKGDKFKTKVGGVITMTTYTVEEVTEKDKGLQSINWSCVGRKAHMKNVTNMSIDEWVRDGRLIQIPEKTANQ